MKTKKITLFYEVTQNKVNPPSLVELERKKLWIEEIQKTIEADWKPIFIKVVYTIFNPEIERMWKFFNGTCVLYYCIQNEHMTEGCPSTEMLKMYRETILEELLGYDVQLVNKITRRRKSTTDFKTVEAWNKFLCTLEETIFDDAGFEFPDSKLFWELVKAHGYEQAKKISVEKLQTSLKRKTNE